MMSLAVGHVSACTCSHHVEKKAVEPSDCHSRHEPVEARTVEAVNDNDACDTSCVCLTAQPSPFIAANPISKKINTNAATATATHVLSHIEFRVAAAYAGSSSEFVSNLPYSSTVKLLLPARAPPRL